MTLIEKKLQELETRPPAFSNAEQGNVSCGRVESLP